VIIFDLDGTLADIEHRRHFIAAPKKEWKAFNRACVDDDPIPQTIRMFELLAASTPSPYIEIWTGRNESVRRQTVNWLYQHVGCYEKETLDKILKMRPDGNYVQDYAMKGDWLKDYTRAGRKIELVFEDRTQVVDMYREAGIPCFQVADGNF